MCSGRLEQGDKGEHPPQTLFLPLKHERCLCVIMQHPIHLTWTDGNWYLISEPGETPLSQWSMTSTLYNSLMYITYRICQILICLQNVCAYNKWIENFIIWYLLCCKIQFCITVQWWTWQGEYFPLPQNLFLPLQTWGIERRAQCSVQSFQNWRRLKILTISTPDFVIIYYLYRCCEMVQWYLDGERVVFAPFRNQMSQMEWDLSFYDDY